MTPAEAARYLFDELQETLDDLSAGGRNFTVHDLTPPQDLGADKCFQVGVSGGESGRRLRIELPTTLAMGYLADEEAAVDEWRLWVRELCRRLGA